MTDSQPTPAVTASPLTVSVVSHTHWDREWYHPAAQFRQRLVALVDALLLEPPKLEAPQPFLLDGQAIVLEDYLSVRPERASYLGERLRSGSIEAGPWYVLADGLIPSAEAIIRNLLTGRRVLRAFGATAPPVAYCPDTFGHPAALPTIAAGFGFKTAVVWRGYGGGRWPAGDTAKWQGADSSEVLLYHLLPDGYETGTALSVDPDATRNRWAHLRGALQPRAVTGVALLPNGADHHALQPDIDAAIAALQLAAMPDAVVRESLGAFVTRLQRAAAAVLHTLPVVRGELRDSYGYTWTLGGTLATRAYQKRNNARAERTLVRDVEPWLVLAWLHGGPHARATARDGALTLAQAPALLDVAWRTLLRTHPHDTLCGCSIDTVARAMDCRVKSVQAQAAGLRTAALELALQHDAVAARSVPLVQPATVVVRNRSAYWRGGVAEVTLDETICDAPVGPTSADVISSVSVGSSGEAGVSALDSSGAPLVVGGSPVQVLRVHERFRRRESPQHYPDNDLVREHRALVWMPPVPPLGLMALPVIRDVQAITASEPPTLNLSGHRHVLSQQQQQQQQQPQLQPQPITVGAAHREPDMFVPARAAVRGENIELGNGILTIGISTNGVRISDGRRVLDQALSIDTCADVGDAYTPAVRGRAQPLQIVSVRRGVDGPLRASAELLMRTVDDGAPITIRATVMLDVGSDYARIDLRGLNTRRDHRLRLNVQTDVRGIHAPALDANSLQKISFDANSLQANSLDANSLDANSLDAKSPDEDFLDTNSREVTVVQVWADAAFGPVQRAPLDVPLVDQQREMVPLTMPMHRWMMLANATVGATLHADGLAEVEARTADGILSLTLLRAIGQLSRSNLPERPGHAGWPASIPAAQVHGVFRARVALQLHGPWSQSTRDVVVRASDAFLLPLVGSTMRDLQSLPTATYPRQLGGPALTGRGLRMSAVKPADDDDGIVLRCVSDSLHTETGSWTLPNTDTETDALEYAPARLDETLLEPWQPFLTHVHFSAPPRAVVTIRVRRRAT